MSFTFVFPGQGSQSVGMLQALSESNAVVRQTFEQASDALSYDLWALCENGPAEELSQTVKTQPALLTAGVAVYRCWEAEGGPQPVCMAGHSLGEFTALVCAGALNFEDAVSLVRDRGQYMQEAVPAGVGAMAAVIGLGGQAVADACSGTAQGDEVLQPVNYNAPGQVVVAGHVAAIERLAEKGRDIGAKRVLPLPVSVPSHSSLMQPAAERLSERLQDIEISAPRIPVIHNVDCSHTDDTAAIREKLVAQLHSPVQWVKSMETIIDSNGNVFVESGPGKVLCGLIKRINRDASAYNVDAPDAMTDCLTALTQ